MDYKATLDFLFSQLPMFQRSGPAAYKNTLENTLKLDENYGHPHRKYKTIHVAGTNGKGSVSHMLAAILQATGYKTGLYTSPHLKDFRERIKIDGETIPETVVTNWVSNFITNNELWKIQPSFFELTVALAFDYFAEQEVDVAIMEVGLGGRLDSTNIITPDVSVITNIGLDHVNLLGDTLEKIAAEKAGIIKTDVPVVIGTTQDATKPVFEQKAEQVGAPIYFADQEYEVPYSLMGTDGKQHLHVEKNGTAAFKELKLDLLGQYQHKNIPAVLKSVEILNEKGYAITEESLRKGLAAVISTTGLLGRWQVLGNNPLIVCDTGHNEDGIKAIIAQLKNTAYKQLFFIFGTVGDKDPGKVLALLPKQAKYYFVKAPIARAMDAAELANRAAECGLKGEAYPSVIEAYKEAKNEADKNDLIFVGGSTFVVAEVL
ncbi:folylpolyglutamate synthase/dihydrofolate synthase family protein [Draconibacterium sp. IB214405]|uniref:bifunctional folylpolyglutamate synthase/dihydrofolate synthase n=1 Tax=Draconibacterium sp. IB214405 TaxID=3097352 RepID=UPI002A0EAFC2|nr:folylpolyglutamate synthase/dihydrofolate synthase family protein [Draconibacterium sp. IB214405]MDX8340658.1 folylpolyglutamate synthase/dihydrofolate synthase family protein [Draconibacterium sp. IB214405]